MIAIACVLAFAIGVALGFGLAVYGVVLLLKRHYDGQRDDQQRGVDYMKALLKIAQAQQASPDGDRSSVN